MSLFAFNCGHFLGPAPPDQPYDQDDQDRPYCDACATAFAEEEDAEMKECRLKLEHWGRTSTPSKNSNIATTIFENLAPSSNCMDWNLRGGYRSDESETEELESMFTESMDLESIISACDTSDNYDPDNYPLRPRRKKGYKRNRRFEVSNRQNRQNRLCIPHEPRDSASDTAKNYASAYKRKDMSESCQSTNSEKSILKQNDRIFSKLRSQFKGVLSDQHRSSSRRKSRRNDTIAESNWFWDDIVVLSPKAVPWQVFLLRKRVTRRFILEPEWMDS